MKVKLTDGKVIELSEPKESHQIAYLDMHELAETGKLTNKEAIAFQNDQIKDLTGLTDDDLLEMTLLDKSKIKSAILSRYVIVGPCNQNTDF